MGVEAWSGEEGKCKGSVGNPANFEKKAKQNTSVTEKGGDPRKEKVQKGSVRKDNGKQNEKKLIQEKERT